MAGFHSERTPVSVSGTVTANAGTNLNTAALATETGNLATVATSAAAMDDWDESDRAKVNPIVGQAGVTGGSGTVDAKTQRMVLATDVALPAGTNNIGDVDVLTLPGAAHDAAVSGNPVRIAGRALSANYTPVATGDTADLVTTLVGAIVNKPYSIPDVDWAYPAAAGGISNTTTAVTFKAASGDAALRSYITSIQISSDPLGAATELAIRDGAGGAVLWRMKIGTAGIVNGLQIAFASPLKSTANTLLEVVTLTASITGGVFFNAQGYTAP